MPVSKRPSRFSARTSVRVPPQGQGGRDDCIAKRFEFSSSFVIATDFGFLRRLQTTRKSNSVVRSLSSVASAPSDLAGSSIFTCKKPETTTILSSGCLYRTARNTSNPSRPGMLKSRVIKSNLVFSTAVNASLPELLFDYQKPSALQQPPKQFTVASQVLGVTDHYR
jgi:hypothetical protein